MANKTVKERVHTMVQEHLGVSSDKLVDNARFYDDLGADSLDQVELVMAAEEEFKINIPDEDYEKVDNLGDMVKLVEKLLEAKDEEEHKKRQ